MDVKEELISLIRQMPAEELQAVMDYVHFLRQSEEVEPTEEELRIIARGRAEFAGGECLGWRSIKTNGI